MNKKYLIILVVTILFAGVIGYVAINNNVTTLTPTNTQVEYTNIQYGFSFSLPEDWKGYSIITDKWEGYSLDINTMNNGGGQTITERGPLISIRNPNWTAQNPMQDIPIMIFTLLQWNELNQDKFHIGAAPIEPSELGRNSTYIFAIPARYNFAFPLGYEEVDTILKNQPLKTF